MSTRSTSLFPIAFVLLVTGNLFVTGGVEASETADGDHSFHEQEVEFRNGDVKLAGSLLLPNSKSPVPAVIFVHGAGRHTREGRLREIGEHFAANGIAALIYDKRGTGSSSGVYESFAPYENLTNDALAGVALLKQLPETSQVGIWGLSQGAYIGAAAASRTSDIKFVITAGASATPTEFSFFYYCDNLFRKYELSDTMRDLAAKGHLARRDFGRTVRDGFRFSSFSPGRYSPNRYIHPAWSGVTQPVLAMWGDLDQNVPVGESVSGMKQSLAFANNERWTMIIVPRANHDLGISETGELQSKWRGYAPGTLQTMTDWVHTVSDVAAPITKMKQQGVARESGVLSRFSNYESLRWYGNAPVQVAHCFFFVVFVINAIAVVWRLLRRALKPALPAPARPDNLKRILCMLNLLILVSFSVTLLSLLDQMRPSCPNVFSLLPMLGTVSMLATVAVVVGFVRSRRPNWPVRRKAWSYLELLSLILFVPFMLYWNLIGYRF